MASPQNRADKHLAKLDRKVGLAATYIQVGVPTIDPATGVETSDNQNVPFVFVRAQALSLRERSELARAGLEQVDAGWKIRESYVEEPKADDQLLLTSSGFKYVVLDARLDRLQADWMLYTRRMRF
jgi:hypothetical protein